MEVGPMNNHSQLINAYGDIDTKERETVFTSLRFTNEEIDALAAVGRAAGRSGGNIGEIIEAIIQDALDAGCRALRVEEEARMDREAQGVQAA